MGCVCEALKAVGEYTVTVCGVTTRSFQMDNAGLSHQELKDAIELIGKEVGPMVNA